MSVMRLAMLSASSPSTVRRILRCYRDHIDVWHPEHYAPLPRGPAPLLGPFEVAVLRGFVEHNNEMYLDELHNFLEEYAASHSFGHIQLSLCVGTAQGFRGVVEQFDDLPCAARRRLHPQETHKGNCARTLLPVDAISDCLHSRGSRRARRKHETRGVARSSMMLVCSERGKWIDSFCRRVRTRRARWPPSLRLGQIRPAGGLHVPQCPRSTHISHRRAVSRRTHRPQECRGHDQCE
jgi:hypothetical protein